MTTTNNAQNPINRIAAMQSIMVDGYWLEEDGEKGDSFTGMHCKIGIYPDDASEDEEALDGDVFYYFDDYETIQKDEHEFAITSMEMYQASLKELMALWKKLSDIPTVYEGEGVDTIESKFLHFDIGTHRETIWHWFEEQNDKFIVGEIMQGHEGFAVV